MGVCVNDTNGDGNCAACARNPEALCRVSAREALFEVMYNWMPRAEDGDTARQANAMLDSYAHELAEKIRNSKTLRDFTDDHMSDCNMAADLIDPEVQA